MPMAIPMQFKKNVYYMYICMYIFYDYGYNLVFPYANTFGLLLRVVSSFVSKESSKPKDHGKQRGIGYEMQMRFLFLHRILSQFSKKSQSQLVSKSLESCRSF